MSTIIESRVEKDATPLVSIVIPVYNGMPFIVHTIESVRRQTYPHWELFICDDRSPDGTGAFLQQYLSENPDERIHLVNYDHRVPMTENWNRSLAYARGKFVKLLPQDDILLPQCIEIQQRILQENPDVGFVTSSREVIDSKGRTLFTRRGLPAGKYEWQSVGVRTLRAVTNIFGEPGAILFRKQLLDTCGAYDVRLGYFVDLELLLRFLKVSSAYVWGSPLCQFRIHSNSVSSASRKIALDEYQVILDRYEEELGLNRKPLLRSFLTVKSYLVVFLRSLVFRMQSLFVSSAAAVSHKPR